MSTKKTLTIPEAGKELGIGRAAAYEAARRGQIPTIRIGRKLLVPLGALERMLEMAGSDHGPEASLKANFGSDK
jgi:excisionase family DNA binding protein